MKTFSCHSTSHASINPNHTTSLLGQINLVAIVILVGFVAVIGACTASPTIVDNSPVKQETIFENAVRSEPTRLSSAREASKRGDREMAIHEYLTSIHEDESTAELAIDEMTQVFLSFARKLSKDGRYVDASAQVIRCEKTLRQLQQVDGATMALSTPAREQLFKEFASVRTAGYDMANTHIVNADRLRQQAKGFWNDDENKQAEALHRVNLAWSYYPIFTQEWMVNKMYEISDDMKNELPTWQYNQTMERDRLQLGRVVGDR